MKNKKLLVCLLVMIMMIAAASVALAQVTVTNLSDLQTALTGTDPDILLTNKILIESGDVVLNSSDSKTITANNVVDAFEVKSGASLTLQEKITITSNTSILYANGGTITVAGADLTTNSGHVDPDSGKETNYSAACAESQGVINVESGSIKGNNATTTLTANGTGKVHISGGSVTASVDGAVLAKNGGTATISGNANVVGLLTAAAARNTGSTVTISGGTVRNTAPANSYGKDWWATTHAVSGGKIIVTGGIVDSPSGRAVVTETNGTAEIKGGTITGGDQAVYMWPTGAAPIVTGGTFSDQSFVDYLADDLAFKVGNGGMLVVTPANANVPTADGGSSHNHPKTGDETNIALLAVLLVASALCMTFMRKKACR